MNFQNNNLPHIDKEVERKISVNTFKEYEKKVNVNTIKTIAVLISLIGAIAGIVLGSTETVYEYYREHFNVGLMLLTWLISDIIAVFLFTAALILEQLLKIRETLKIWNQTGIISHQSSANIDNDDTGTSWKCKSCGKINENYVGTCGCGQLRDKNESE